MIEKQSEYLQKLPVANPVYTNGQTKETKYVEEASSSVCLDDEVSSKASSWNVQIGIPILSGCELYNYSNDDIWYKKQKMGKDRINTIMKRMAASTGLSGGKKQIIQLEKQWLHVLPRIVYQKHRLSN